MQTVKINTWPSAFAINNLLEGTLFEGQFHADWKVHLGSSPWNQHNEVWALNMQYQYYLIHIGSLPM